ncbi:MAG: Lrp/AsnC family transcriptional regulator [Spirochaetes bacterium]|nr:Lrp/AsnC family transcriptional regulator [Spirochaetota bacterium]MBX3722943.1 Lrp/AsnC family transcriptional regulator [Turneriella sp.]
MLKTLGTEELKVLNALGDNGLLTNGELSTLVKLDEKQVAQIRADLEAAGIILKYRAIINWEKIESSGVNALIQVKVTPAQGQGYDEVARKVAAFPEVRTCLLVSGSFDLLVEVDGPSLRDVAFFVADKLATIEGVNHTSTNFLLKRYKQSGDMFSVSGKTHRLPMMI